MPDNLTYEAETGTISQQKMQFNVINHYPKYLPLERETIKSEIERQLFIVFSKYVHSN